MEYSTKQSKIKKVSSLFFPEFPVQKVVDDLREELSRVRRTVYQEQNLMKHTSTNSRIRDRSAKKEQLALQSKRKRLMHLFIKDLCSGICGEVVANKTQRDALSHPESTENRVTLTAQVFGWILVFLMNMGMLLYIYLFALTQTHSRQSAWLQSFVIWFIFEIFVSSTGLVICFHFLIPLYVFTEVSKVKDKVLSDLISFRKKYLRTFLTVDQESGGDLTKDDFEFNAAKYMFVSWRVASLFPELPESGLILQFSTSWPKRKFGTEESHVSQEYDEAVILTALSRVFIFFVASLLRYHVLIQDIIVQLVCNSGLASLILLFIQATKIHPLLPVACVLILFLSVLTLLRCTMSGHNLKEINAVEPQPQVPPPESVVNHHGIGQQEGAEPPDTHSHFHTDAVLPFEDESKSSNLICTVTPSTPNVVVDIGVTKNNDLMILEIVESRYPGNEWSVEWEDEESSSSTVTE